MADLVHTLLDLLKNPLTVLTDWIDHFGPWIYLLLFLIVFCETGLVFMPPLPGDSLLFAAGALAGTTGKLEVVILIPLLIVAALLGDNVNYHIGRALGPRVFSRPRSRLFNPEHLSRTREFYERHGRKAVILARFAPILRTCAPFVAGVGAMRYRIFLTFSVIGAVLWVGIFVSAGAYFGQQEVVRKNFTHVILGIVIISLLPAAYGFLQSRLRSRNQGSGGEGN